MKNKIHKVRDYLIKTNYLNHYSLRLLIGSLFLIVPASFVILLIALWKNLDFVWVPLLFGTIGYCLILPSACLMTRTSERHTAINTLFIGLLVMLCLCSFIIPLRLERESLEILNARAERIASQNHRNECLEPARLHYEKALLDLREKEIAEGENP
ncbi:MAG: hypothetical protein KBD90_00205 [Alphaproteobacteria bacterium]|nr:hypothetical protein [Alphaproteobacteria bacterium]